ncbi:MAG TPA: epoxide hydrolase [Candidatus Dormibacteraeota bacterium]|jgi:pimeloyl-ACP methyl ester carboxylesterase|nr:epoxide hydrolase [Candidatus Dormibacteraeota bacterium]
MTDEITPFRIEIPDIDLDRLHRRLEEARWPAQLPGGGWVRGVPVAELRVLAEHWRDGFDWRRQEARLNALPQFTTRIEGLDIHFLHIRSREPDALPLLLSHGWPNSIVEFLDLIDPLVDPAAHGREGGRAFDVVAPSVPGFGLSTAPRQTGFSTERVARIWAELMRRLGYERYGVEGGDLGAYVAPEVALAAPDHVAGVYVIGGLGLPTEADLPELTEDERAAFAALGEQSWRSGVDHHALLRAAPQTFAYGWHDSPLAALAWMAQKFHEFTVSEQPLEEVIDPDLFLTNLSVYWFTGSFGSSSWPMYDSTGFAWPRGQREAPTGVYSGPPGIRRLAERHNHIVHWPEGNRAGHHFVAMERPEALAADMAIFFAAVG